MKPVHAESAGECVGQRGCKEGKEGFGWVKMRAVGVPVGEGVFVWREV